MANDSVYEIESVSFYDAICSCRVIGGTNYRPNETGTQQLLEPFELSQALSDYIDDYN